MQPSLEAPASVNVTLALPSSPLCSSRWRAALPVGLRYIKAPLANFAMKFGRAAQLDAPGPSSECGTPLDANLLLELTRKAGCDSDSGA